MKTTNIKSREYVKTKTPFQAHNLSGDRTNGLYIVKSYAWYPLFVYDFDADIWLENKEKYSVSTSKQKTQCRPLEKTQELTLDEIEKYIREKTYV